ncbi:MAG: DNA polymerase III subunit beta [Christensenellaceae bacterium]|jgi:DNA polymerase-3 subunit beta|nr:DNA polymerase III subunit beta [Christensenellaceae bacterium]
MQFKCSTSDLASAATIISKALPSRAVPLILNGILFKAIGKTITLTASNNEFTITKEISAQVKIEGQVLVDGRTFAEFIKKVSCEEVEISEDSSTSDENDQRRLKLVYNESNVLYLYCLENNYPSIEDNIEDYDLEVSQGDFKEIIEQGSYSISTEDARPALKGCLLETRGDNLLCVSLDGYRMAIIKCGIKEKKNDIKALVSGKNLVEVAKVLESNEEELEIKKSSSFFFIKKGTTKIIMRILDMDFYDYEGIIPKEFNTELLLSKEPLEKCIERVSLMCKAGGNDCLKINIIDNEMKVSTRTEVADITETVKFIKTGSDLEIAFNNRFLREALSKCKDKEIKLKIISPVKPVIIVPVEGEKFKHIVLPIRL